MNGAKKEEESPVSEYTMTDYRRSRIEDGTYFFTQFQRQVQEHQQLWQDLHEKGS